MKKLLAIFLCLCALCSLSLPALANEAENTAEESYAESVPEENEVESVPEEEYVREFQEHKIFVDGKEVPCEPAILVDGYTILYRYTSLAEALGLTVSFDAEAGLVHTDGNGYAITFDAIGANTTVTENGEPIDVYEDEFTFVLYNMEDKLYIEDFAVDYKLADYSDRGIRVDDGTNDIYIYTAEGKRAMADELNQKISMLNSMQAEIQDKDYLSESTGEFVVNIKSDFLDIEGNGQTTVQISSAKLGEKNYTKIHTEGKGLMNLIPLLTGISSSYGTDEAPEAFPNTTDVEIYQDGMRFYIKGEEQARQLIMGEAAWLLYEDPEEVAEVTKQWVYTDNIPESYTALLKDGDLGTYLVDAAFTAGNDTAPEILIDVFGTLFGNENFTVTDNAQGKTYTYTLNKETFLAALSPVLADMSDEERAAFDKQMEQFGFEMSAVQNTTKEGGVSLSEASISLSNIENPWNEQMLSLQISVKSSANIAFSGANSFAFPDVSQAVNLTEFADKLMEEDAEAIETENE
ncbi:MAG: hypothetical protein IJC78_00220 [Clostridia bacterium]|nr:hypothetical protein [Clostridia bacterium]